MFVLEKGMFVLEEVVFASEKGVLFVGEDRVCVRVGRASSRRRARL